MCYLLIVLRRMLRLLIDFSGTKTGATLCFKVFYSYQLIHAFSLFLLFSAVVCFLIQVNVWHFNSSGCTETHLVDQNGLELT